ncbi:MAG: four helix bundle suffix domain-containing protein [Paludibacteraceae bacterium]|nr:four helix bundle suffix domain-containing protein [Paludibacteraceae bacterium]
MATLNKNGFLQYPGDYHNLLFYKKAVILYDMTYWYQDHYLQRGDRTKDQMEQAARSGKQNVVEGKADGMTSKEMEIKLLNTARGSLLELMEDYEDQLRSRRLEQWTKGHPRYEQMVQYCYRYHDLQHFRPYYERWTIEEFCNVALTLIHQADRGLLIYLREVEKAFLEQGGLKEQMSAARRRVRGY